MRLYTKKLLQVLLAVFLIFVIYLNLNVTDLSSDRHTHGNNGLPWGDDFGHRKRPSLTFVDRKIHDHVLRFESALNASKPEPKAQGDGSHSNGHSDASNKEATAGRGKDSLLGLKPGPKAADGGPGDVYPSSEFYNDDRIRKQLKFVSKAIGRKKKSADGTVPLKKIMVYSGTGSWHIPRGTSLFKEQQCSVQACELVDDRSRMNDADVVLFQHPVSSGASRPANQVWALFMLESPYHTPSFTSVRDVFNWTATYRHDSTIVAPYEKYVPLNDSLLTRTPTKNYAAGKTKKVAWFVSNCGARNGRRRYAEELAKYIQVDIYGGCGTLKCPRFQSEKCFGMLNTDYKFYLAFENSNCRDYITEKFFINGLQHDVVPIAMGAAPEDYRNAAPPHSFIHVDDFASAKDLADYLHRLDQDDSLYNQYFAWKGLWNNINTYFWCRMCAMAHDVEERGNFWHEDVENWWRGPGVCIGQNTWRQTPPQKPLIADLAVGSPAPPV